jgi:chromosome segregation ATPase
VKRNELNNHIRVTEGKLIELSKRLSEAEEKGNILIKDKSSLENELKKIEESNSITNQSARKKLHKLATIVDELRSELRHTKKEYGICIDELTKTLNQQVDMLFSMTKHFGRRK